MLEVSSDDFEDITKIKALFSEFNATYEQKLVRSEYYTLTCKYRMPILAQHIFSKYLFKSESLFDVKLNDI